MPGDIGIHHSDQPDFGHKVPISGARENTVSQAAGGRAIEVRVEEVSQLFSNLDPFPFRERDLDKDAEEYIVGWARELPKSEPIRIVVHLPKAVAKTQMANELEGALTRYFDYRAEVIALDINELFRVGRISLMIGLVVLALCITLSQAVASHFGTGPFDRFVEESLIIVGWVANWKPIEIFLYDWWPIARRRDLYRRLAKSSVELRPYVVANGR